MFRTAAIGMMMVALLVFVAACSPGNDHEHQLSLEPTVPVEVEVLTEPTELKVGEEVRILAKVTQGGELVDDVDRVRFEWWMDGQNEEDHVFMDGEPQDVGIYGITVTFEEPGTYYVIPHTDARGMHTMPTATLEVGE